MACKKKNPERQIFTTNITTIGIQSFNLLGNFSKIIQEKENIYIVNLIFLGPENIIQEQLNFIHPEIELLNPEESFIEPNADLNQNFNHEVIYTVKRKKNEEKAVITTNPETDQEREQGIIYKVRVKIQNLKDLSDKICAFSVDQTQGFIRYISENKADINLYFFDDQPNLTNIVPTIKLCDEQAKLAPAANIPQNFTKIPQ